jgi:hypothetical protein
MDENLKGWCYVGPSIAECVLVQLVCVAEKISIMAADCMLKCGLKVSASVPKVCITSIDAQTVRKYSRAVLI